MLLLGFRKPSLRVSVSKAVHEVITPLGCFDTASESTGFQLLAVLYHEQLKTGPFLELALDAHGNKYDFAQGSDLTSKAQKRVRIWIAVAER